MSIGHIGKPTNRVDGRAKVTGSAKYAGDFAAPDLAYGYVVTSPAAKGTISHIDAEAALQLPGVLGVLTHANLPRRLTRSDRSYRDDIAPPGSPFRPLHDDLIRFSTQPVALVVADHFELARFAASLVRVSCESHPHLTELDRVRHAAYKPRKRAGIEPPKSRGNAYRVFAEAAVQMDADYQVPIEHHNPMEMFAATVLREENGDLTVYDKTQGVQNVQGYLSRIFRLSKEEVRVVSPFVGGAFGSGLRPQYHVFLAVLAAQEFKRSVRVTLTRQQMFSLGYRPMTTQHVSLGAAADGTLAAIIHEIVAGTSHYEDFSESVANWSALLYRCPNVRVGHKLAKLDLCTPLDMRAPGAAWGMFALESAMDELAVKLSMDPVELRLKNYADVDQVENKPFTSKELRECYRQGAEKFGWARRLPGPRSMHDGNQLVGWGMATGTWETHQLPASAKAVLTPDGRLTVSSATADIGTGTYTIMTQIAADLLGLPLENVTFKLGDSSLSQAPVEGGSFTAASVGSAVMAACHKVRDKLVRIVQEMENSPLANAASDEIVFSEGSLRMKQDASRAVSVAEILRHRRGEALEVDAAADVPQQKAAYSSYAHSAVFAEVRIDEDFGSVRVSRVVSAVAAGRILNPKTARSQVMGGVVWGISMALHEESLIDHALGRIMNHNLAEYHIPVHADVQQIDVLFIDEPDEIVNPLGVKGLGEIGIVGVAAAIANAVFHATGKRIRDLPITLDKVM